MASAWSRSASSRALRPVSWTSWEVMTPRLARACVSSSFSTTSPADTRSPFLTRISATMPPEGCCTFLMLLSTTTVPDAITAPAIGVVTAHTPQLNPKSPIRPMPRSSRVANGRSMPPPARPFASCG